MTFNKNNTQETYDRKILAEMLLRWSADNISNLSDVTETRADQIIDIIISTLSQEPVMKNIIEQVVTREILHLRYK